MDDAEEADHNAAAMEDDEGGKAEIADK